MAEYTPTPDPDWDYTYTYTIPGYGDVVDGELAFKEFANDIDAALHGIVSLIDSPGGIYVTADTHITSGMWRKIIICNSGTPMTVTVDPSGTPPNAFGNTVSIVQYGAGQVTIAGGAGVTLRSAAGLKTRAPFSVVTLTFYSGNTWIVYGDTVA